MPKFLSETAEETLVGKGWKPMSATNLYYSAIKSGDSKGKGRLSIQFTITDGKWDGEVVYGGGSLVGGWSRVTMAQLKALNPDVDWKEYDFPTPPEERQRNPDELAELLIGRELWGLVEHTKGQNGEPRAEVKRVAPIDAEHELNEDDED